MYPSRLTIEFLTSMETVKTSLTKWFMLFYNKWFAQCRNLCFLLFDQRMRHKFNNQVYMKFIGESKFRQQGQNLINAEDFDDRLRQSQLNSNGRFTQNLINDIMTYVRLSAENVPWGSYERRKGIFHMQALQHCFYEPSVFITFVPDDVDSVLELWFMMERDPFHKHGLDVDNGNNKESVTM